MENIGSTHRQLWEMIRDEVRSLIVLGDLPPGHRLIEEELARRFGVSRGPVRTALAALERSGLVHSSPRRAVHVASFSVADVDEIFGVRRALEMLALENVEGSVRKGALAPLSRALDRLEDAQTSGQALAAVEADLSFHRELCRLSHNRRLLHAWQDLADQIEVVMAAVHRVDPTVASRTGQHRVVLSALESGNPRAAREALARHLQQSHSVMSEIATRSVLVEPEHEYGSEVGKGSTV